MKIFRKTLILTAVVVVLFNLSSCNTAAGFGMDVHNTGTAITQAATS